MKEGQAGAKAEVLAVSARTANAVMDPFIVELVLTIVDAAVAAACSSFFVR